MLSYLHTYDVEGMLKDLYGAIFNLLDRTYNRQLHTPDDYFLGKEDAIKTYNDIENSISELENDRNKVKNWLLLLPRWREKLDEFTEDDWRAIREMCNDYYIDIKDYSVF